MGSNNIEQHPHVQPSVVPQNPETPVQPNLVEPELNDYANGSENGAIYFELNWETGQAHHRQQQLLTTFPGYPQEIPTKNTDYNPHAGGYGNSGGFESNSYGENSYLPNSYGGNQYGFGGNGYDYNGNPHENFPYGYVGNSTNPNYYPFGAGENNPLDYSQNPSLIDWNDLMDWLGSQPDFSNYQDESNDFWRDLQRFSETTIFQNNDFNESSPFQNDQAFETENTSIYERLLSKLKSKETPPDEFAENLPPEEQKLFKARYQIDEILGEDAFRPDGVTLTEAAQVRLIETAVANDQIEFLPENVQREIREGNAFAVGEDGRIVVVPRETGQNPAGDAEIAFTNGDGYAPNRLVSEKIENGELKPLDKSAQIAVGQNNAVVLNDNGSNRAVNHNQIDNSSSVSSIARRDGGTILGGALISGSFSSIENFKNAESNGIGNSGSVENNNFGGRNNFEAGATGAMMSAAIGSLVPSSDAVISGVVGFISGVVIGVEADQGLRWLSGDRPTAIAPSNNVNLLEENSFAPPLQPILA